MRFQRLEEFVARHPRAVAVSSITLSVSIGVVALVFREELAELRRFGYVGIFLISLLGNATILFPVPGLLSAFVGGGLFSPPLVGLFGALGAACGELTGYFAGLGGQGLFDKRKRFVLIEGQIRRYGVWGLFVLAAIPNPFFDMAGIAAGIMKIPLPAFFLATFCGQFVKFVLVSYLGAGTIDRFYSGL